MRWIKLFVGAFDGFSFGEIMARSRAQRNELTAVWFELLALAGKCNNCGNFWDDSHSAHMNIRKIAIHINRKESELKRCMDFFVKEKMIDFDGEKYCITNWQKYQNEDKLEQIRKNARERQRRCREKKKEVESQNSEMSDSENAVTKEKSESDKCVTDSVTVTQHISDAYAKANSDKSNSNTNYVYIQNLFNEKCRGIMPKITSLSDKRKRMMKACQKYLEPFGGWEALIEKIVSSDFLSGRTGTDWQLTIDWILNIDNTTKIMEGNYDNSKRKKPSQPDPAHDKWLGSDYTGPDLPF